MKKFYCLLVGVVVSIIGGATLATVFPSDTTQTQPTQKINDFSASESTQPEADPSTREVTTSPQNSTRGLAQKPRLDNFPHQRLNLVDQVQPESDFYEFRERLRQAVRDRDASFIRSIATPDIRLSFGGPFTLDDVDLDNPKAPIWISLEKVLTVGCAKPSHPVERPTWICPHIFEVWPDNIDAFTYVAILGENVNVRSQADTISPVVAVLSNEAIELDQKTQQQEDRYDFDNPNGWTPIILPKGQRGYVLNSYVYSPIGYRGFFEKIQGEWKMTIFVAGD